MKSKEDNYTETLALRVPADLKAAVEDRAKSMRISTGAFCRLAIANYIADLKSVRHPVVEPAVFCEPILSEITLADPAFGLTQAVDSIARLSDALVNVGNYLDDQLTWEAGDQWVDPRPGIVALIDRITTTALEA